MATGSPDIRIDLLEQQLIVLQKDAAQLAQDTGKHLSQIYHALNGIAKTLEAFNNRLEALEPKPEEGTTDAE